MVSEDELAERLRESLGRLVHAGWARPDAMPEHRAQTLGFLMHDGPLTISELAQRRRVRHQTMQAAVIDLEQDGLVKREPDPRDRRARLVRPTEKGLKLLRRELDGRRSLLAEAIAAELDEREQSTLAQVPDLLLRLARRLAQS
ncbi:MarR family winged helix-turn-helix transcriptional regulator [Streptomyces blattellae]|uniref:MarR family winged helix-turn-helix transcriptional regulator n=1 Tax=Streptomyces blattellae TaxID=2569855 RepID=UPI0012B804E9|nr:MarR family transcriptional regulator [Streptomyces blattellae]